MDDPMSADQVAAITSYVDIHAAPPDIPTALFLFGTNQTAPAAIASARYHQGLAPLIIVTGGINRHNGIVEGREFRRQLVERGVPESVIRVEDTSANTWQNVELSIPYLTEAITAGLPVTAVSKWYHRRTIHILRTRFPQIGPFYAIGWEPIYGGTPVTRTTWLDNTDGRRRVIREWQEVSRRLEDGSLVELSLTDGTWQ
jgi:uncharacterized SAM-binding protein YcdF (DUF218 family)